MDAERRVEGRLPRQRQRRLRGRPRLQLRRDGSRDQARLRLRDDRSRDGAGDPAQRRRPRRTSRQVERLGNAGDPRSGGRRQADREGVLWRRRQALLLHRLLDRRSAGTHRGGVFPRGLRRHSRWRAGRQPDVGARGRRDQLPGGEPEARAQALRRQPRASHQVCYRRLRRQGQRPQVRSVHRRPVGLRLRPRRAHLQGRRS